MVFWYIFVNFNWFVIRGDEASVYSDEVKKDATPAIPDDFYYDYEELVSKPRITGQSPHPNDVLLSNLFNRHLMHISYFNIQP